MALDTAFAKVLGLLTEARVLSGERRNVFEMDLHDSNPQKI